MPPGWTVQWDLNYNGLSFNPSATSATVVVSAHDVAYPASRKVALRVTDALGRTSYAFTDVQVNDGTSGRVVNEVPNVNVDEPFR